MIITNKKVLKSLAKFESDVESAIYEGEGKLVFLSAADLHWLLYFIFCLNEAKTEEDLEQCYWDLQYDESDAGFNIPLTIFNYLSNKFRPDYDCTDCKVDTQNIDEYYMIQDKVWDAIAKEDEMLCISCLEKRLNRKLIKTDFIDCPVNLDHVDYPKSPRLMERLNT